MTEVDRLAEEAAVPRALAAMVAEAANRAGVSLRCLRADDRRPHLVRERQRLVLLAREQGFSSCQIGRALNRDHSTILLADRRARVLVEAGLLVLRPPVEPAPHPVQLGFLPGPLFDFVQVPA